MADFDISMLDGLSQYEFLSPQWLEEFRGITERLGIEPMRVDVTLRMNQIISGCPFQEEPLKAYLDTSSGVVELDLGELEEADLTVSLDYETAKALFVEFNPQRAIESFIAGKILVTGDMTKLLGLTQVFAGRTDDDPMSTLMKAITS
ncbi:MAG: hypothetical protein ACP5HZ_07335 [Ferrimicrobium sp.]|uniref:hypothetical protein n=1 Tax=Ferrimicrobium sp. TaxID=2926050 RepID=UPI0026211DA4|nr:hypothetical protein [Ferrimicrobium sp.]